MADESSFLIQILLDAKDNASAKIAALTAEVEALKRAASGDGGPTSSVSSDLDKTGQSARDAERDLKGVRQEHERLRQSSRGSEVRQTARDIDDVGSAAKTTEPQIRRVTAATDDHRSAASRLGTGLKQSSRDTDESRRSLKSAAEQAEETAKSYEMFDTAVRKGGVGTDDARRGYAQFAIELGGLARQLKSGSDEATRFSRIADEARSRSKDLGPSEAEIARVTNAYKQFNNEVKSGSMTTAEVRRGYKDLSSELGNIGRSFRAGSAEAQHFLGMAEQAGKRAKEAGYLAPGDWNWDSVIAKTAARFDDWGIKVVSLSANLRGLALAAVVGLAQQLDTAVVGLAGGLFSVASAAVQAGAALGGALVSGLSQAIPVLAIVGAAVQRLKSVFQAVSLSNQAEIARAGSPNKAATTQLQQASAVVNAEHSLQQAYENVAVAQERVRSSQEALTLARIDAKRNVEDLELAEKNAKLEAEGASISLVDAQRALQAAIQQGNTAGIQSAQLAVSQAELGVTKADQAVPRAVQDANRARRQGVEGNPAVVSARQAEEQARKQVTEQKFQIKQAQDQLRIARMQAQETTAGQPSQQNQLEQLKKNFTGPEKALYESLKKIESMLKSPSSPLAKLSDYIVEPIAKGVSRITQLLGSKSAMQPLDNLAKSMGASFTEIEHTLTDNKAVHFFDEMAEDASKNVPLVSHAFSQLLEFFQDIAKTAAPFLHDIIKGFDQFATNLNTKFSSPAGLEKLRSFFDKAEKYAMDFAHLAGSFGHLMMALGRDAAPSGDNLVTSLTNSMNKATEWVNTHGPQVRKFFDETAEVVKQIGILLFGIGVAMFKAFNPASTAAFQQFITQIILPALTKIVQVLGWITTAVMNIAKAIPGGTVALQALVGAMTVLFGIGKLYEPIAKVVTIMKALRVASEAFMAAQGMSRLTAAWEAFHGVMNKVKDTTVATRDAQIGLNAAEEAGVATATADAAAQGELAAAESAGGAAGTTGLLAKLGFGGIAARAGVGAGVGLAGYFAGKEIGGNAGSILSGASTGAGIGFTLGGPIGGVFGAGVGGTISELKSATQLGFSGDAVASQINKLNSALQSGKFEKAKELAQNLKLMSYEVSPEQAKKIQNYLNTLEGTGGALSTSAEATRKWSEKMKHYLESLGPAAKNISETFQNINTSTGSILEQIRQVVHTNSKKIAEDLGTNSKEGKDALIANFGGAVNAINNAMAEGNVSAGKGMQEIGRQVATALKEYGINPASINKYIANTSKIPAQYGSTGGRGAEYNRFAEGGWVDSPGQQGPDNVHALLGRGEAVLNWPQQQIVNMRMAMGGYVRGLQGVFDESKGVKHFAKGGFVADSGTNFSYNQEPKIASALQRLGEFLHTTIYGISGARSQSESAALGYPNDPHTKGEAADIGVGSNLRASAARLTAAMLAKFGLYRPFYPSMGEKEINHVQLISGSAAANAIVRGQKNMAGAMAAGYEIAAPKVKGLHGQLQKVAQGALNKVATAASEYVTSTIGSLPTPESGGKAVKPGSYSKVKGKGGSPSANEKLGREMMIKAGFPASEWDDLKKLWTQESGWNDTAENNPSMGWLANGNASGIPQSDGHGQVYRKGDARGQIAWGLNYIKQRYGSIAKAWASEMAIKSYAAGGYIKQALMMAMGGQVAPWGGKPVMIEAHEGERVMNPMQYGEAARLAGTTSAGLDKHMGYDGSPKQSFDVGGLIPPRVVSQKAQAITRSGGVHESSLSDMLNMATSALSSESAIVKVFKAIHNGFASLKKIENKAGVFTKAVIPFIESITNEQTGVLARLQAGFTAMTTRLNTASAKANFKVVKTSVQSGRLVSSASPLEQTDRSLKDLATERKNLEQQQKIIAEVEKQIQARIKALQKKKQTSAVKKELQQLVAAYNSVIASQFALEEQISQNLESAAQQAQQRVQEIIANINNTIGLKGSEISARQGTVQALGRFSELPAIDAQIADNAREHIQALEGALKEANAIDDTEMAATIRGEIIQLQQTVQTAAAQAIQDAEQAIQQQGGLASSQSQLMQVRAQIFGSQGQYGNELNFARRGYQEEISNSRGQIGNLDKLLYQARSEGNEGAIISLTEQIRSLESSILQNEQALKDNTAIITQQYISQVTRQGQFATGVYGGLISILKTAGEITGKTDVAGEAKLYEQSNQSLNSTNKELIGGPQGLNSFLASLGISAPNLEGLSGSALVEAIGGMNLSGIEEKMDPAQQQAFEQIIGALIQNSEQIETNNKELANLNGSLTQLQTFSTTVFQRFRDSVFTGIGGLLPTYAEAAGAPPNTNNPGLTGAGSLEAPLLPGSVEPAVSKISQPMIGEQHNYFTEPVEVLEPDNVGRKIAFGMKTP